MHRRWQKNNVLHTNDEPESRILVHEENATPTLDIRKCKLDCFSFSADGG
jgi:hypothetical protein